ncbi:hypothetical protein NP603_13965, partial [Methylomonas sp. SURF-1]
MGWRVAREVLHFDSLADFLAEDGANHGEGSVIIGGTSHRAGLIPSSTKEAVALLNTAMLQKWLNSGAKTVALTLPGRYAFAGGDNAQAIITIPSDTTLYVGPGVILDNIAASFGLSKTLFCNEHALSNAVAVTGLTHAQDTNYNWTSTVVVNIGSVSNEFAVGDYIYIRPAYAGGDTTGFYNYIYKVTGIDNSDSDNKKILFKMACGSDANHPTLTGDLIVYKADANIKIYGEGRIRQATQNRGSGNIRGAISYQQIIMNKVINSYVDIGLTESPGSVTAGLANVFKASVKNSHSDNSNGVWVHGNCYGVHIDGVSGESKDDLITIFADSANTPIYDGDGVTACSVGNVDGVEVNFRHEPHRKSSSQGVSMISSQSYRIDNVTIRGYKGSDISGQPFQLSCGYGINGVAKYGAIKLIDCEYVPRKGRPLGYMSSGAGGGSMTVDNLIMQNVRVPAIASADGNAGFMDVSFAIWNVVDTSASHLIKNFSLIDCEFNFDCTSSNAINM